MSLKQSCFKSVIKCDLKRSWWISALAALLIFMTSTTQLFSSYGYIRHDNMLDFCEYVYGNYVVGIVVAVFSVLFMFSYINKVNSVSFFHSLPITRNGLLTAHIISSAILIVSPMLLNTIISFFAVGKGVKASWILASFCLYLLYSFVVFSLTLVVAMLTGVSIAGGIFTVVAALLPLFVFVFAGELCNDYLYGYAGFEFFEKLLLDFIYLSPEALLSAKSVIYIIITSAFIALSYLIYNKRHLENHDEVIAFPELKGLFKVLFGLCAGVLSYYYFEAFWSISSILTMLVFGTLGVVIANMLSNKSLSLRGVVRPIIICTSCILALFVVFFFDIFGFEKRIPDIDDIEYAEFGGMYYEEYRYVDSEVYGVGNIKVTRKEPYVPYFKSREEIEMFLDLHKYAIDHQNENDNWNDDFITPSYRITERQQIDIEYTLKNGRVMKRSYYLPVNELEKYTSKIYETDTYRKWKYPLLDGTEKTYTNVSVFDVRTYDANEYVPLTIQNEGAQKIIDALKKDRKNISYARMQANDHSALMSVELNYNVPFVSKDGKEYLVECSETYAVSEFDENTWAVLEELDLFADVRKITIDDVKGVNVYSEINFKNDDFYDTIGDLAASAAQMEARTVISKYDVDIYNAYFTESEEIDCLYNLYMNHHNEVVEDGESYAVLIIGLDLSDGTTRSRTIVLNLKDVPEFL